MSIDKSRRNVYTCVSVSVGVQMTKLTKLNTPVIQRGPHNTHTHTHIHTLLVKKLRNCLEGKVTQSFWKENKETSIKIVS